MKLILGDCLQKLSELPTSTIDCVVTDPPYGLEFMGKKWDYATPSVDTWRECLRVLKPGGHLLSFGGTRTYHRLVVSIEDAGFEIRDQIQWIYGTGFPKSHNLEGAHEGWGTALKPANEPICLARKPLEKGLTVAQNVQKWGTGALNIDGTRIATEENLNGGAYSGEDRASQTGDIMKIVGEVGEYKQPTGRWPANILFDEAAAAMLDEQSGQSKSPPIGSVANVKKHEGFEGKSFAIKSRVSPNGHGDSGGASRFFYVAKSSKRERNAGMGEQANGHPTVKPTKLMEYLITLVCPPQGIVLDPFMGSGTTGVAAKRLGVEFIGIEREEEYLKIAEARIVGTNDCSATEAEAIS